MGGSMQLVFSLEDVILKPEDKLLWAHCQPLFNVVDFIQWLKDKENHITIWTHRPNTLESKHLTEQWLELQQVPYDRLLFDKPKDAVFIDETPPNAKYHKHIGDNSIVAMLFEEWKEWKTKQEE